MSGVPLVGYCGNVHPASSVAQVLNNLRQHASAVQRFTTPDQALPLGIWLSQTALRELEDEGKRQQLRDALEQYKLHPFTINGFPLGDFHQPVVKQSVYEPDWTTAQRLNYTVDLARLHDDLLPGNQHSTISTLPLGWPSNHPAKLSQTPRTRLSLTEKAHDGFLQRCAVNLRKCATQLAQLSQKTGRDYMVCIEPEPGCVIDSAKDVCDFFDQWLFTGTEEHHARKHIGVCHDVCHSAVMFEEQHDAFLAYWRSGIQVGKVQVSSALEVDFGGLADEQRSDALHQLRKFSEPKYLHQTCVEIDGVIEYFQDLPEALAHFESVRQLTGLWRVHFHVPIFAQRLGSLGTTQHAIKQCVEAIQLQNEPAIGRDSFRPPQHYEIETYAWNVLPARYRSETLATDIAAEISWFKKAHPSI